MLARLKPPSGRTSNADLLLAFDNIIKEFGICLGIKSAVAMLLGLDADSSPKKVLDLLLEIGENRIKQRTIQGGEE